VCQISDIATAAYGSPLRQMNDYSKWEKLADEEEEEERREKDAELSRAEFHEACREEQQVVEQWLKRNMRDLLKSAQSTPKDPHAPPELIRNSQTSFRRASKEDLRVLSMLMVLSHFEEGETNLQRHPQLLDLVRQNRWLEEDPGAMELICQIHNLHMKSEEDKGRPPVAPAQEKLENRFRHMCLSAVNTLAASKKAGCPGGLLEVINAICTPKTPQAQEMRLKWQKKEYGKDALFDSLFPDLKQFKDDYDKQDSWWDIWLMLGFLLLLIAGLAAVFFYGLPMSSKTATTTVTTTAMATGSATSSPTADEL